MNHAVNPMSLSSSITSWKSSDAVPDQFPAGLRVLVVDDDPTCLKILERMLRSCHYEVTKCSRAEVALKLLRDNQDGFDVVISDVHMPDMDGFELLEQVGLKMDLPVIMMSADDSQNVVMKGVTHGACDYLIKPVRMEALKNIWQHVVRKKKHEWKDKDLEQSGSVEDGERNQKLSEDVDYSSSANEGNWKSSKKRKDEEDEAEERDDTSALKKPRVVWSVELHQQFVTAVNQLGIDKAVPKKILELMNVPGLTRENVASHLQKYRLYLRRLSGQHQNGLGNSFMGPHDGPYGSIPSYHGLDLQALASSGQLPPQSLATIQAAALSRSSNKSIVPVPLVDKPNIFSYDNSKNRGPQQHNNGKQVSLLHGIPTNMDSKQLAALHQSAHPFANINMNVHSQSGQSNSLLAHVVQPPPRTQLLNAIGSSHGLNLPSSVGQPPFLGQYGINNVRSPAYTSLSQSSSSLVDFSRTQGAEFPGTTFSTFNSKGMLNEELNPEMKGSKGFVPNFDVFNELNQNRTEDWGLQNAGPAFHSPQQSNVDLVQSGLTLSVSKAAAGLGNNTDFRQQNGLPDLGFQNGIFPNQIVGQEDLMSALLKQHDSRIPVENEFGFDEYHLDNLPV